MYMLFRTWQCTLPCRIEELKKNFLFFLVIVVACLLAVDDAKEAAEKTGHHKMGVILV
jgi:hypothetical protein